jgi:hypothetical protein
MSISLKELKAAGADTCITVILNTHRTLPDNQKDRIHLKNLVKEAENRLLAGESKREAAKLITRLNELADRVDHRMNQDSLILFVNDRFSEYTRLPIGVSDRVVIGPAFSVRDLARARQLDTAYYVLVLSRDKARLIEAFNDTLVEEKGGPFPIENTLPGPVDREEPSNASRQRNLVAEFFNRVDKAVNELRKQKPLPVLICSEEENYHEYLKIADEKHSLFEMFLSRSRQTEKAQAIVSEAWELVCDHTKRKNLGRREELQQAVSAGKFLGDVNEIRRGIPEGRIQTLFIESDLFRPAVIEEEYVIDVSPSEKNRPGLIDDIFEELTARILDSGGDVVFLDKGELKKYNGFGAITRY